MDAGVPHPNQSAYRKSVSCADAIFATQEVLNRYLLEGGKVYMCLIWKKPSTQLSSPLF